MDLTLPEGAQRVQSFLTKKGSDARVRLLPASTATALDAATALGVPVSRIGKSIVFRSEKGVAVVVVGGDKLVDVASLADKLGVSNVKSLRAEDVKSHTGYVIGGVSPFGLPPTIAVIVDEQLKTFPYCYVAAGHPKAVVRVEFNSLVALTNARVETIAKVRGGDA
jgi:Cys-tRNA(Pro) deacylase